MTFDAVHAVSAYFDPNDHGNEGYGLFGSVLLRHDVVRAFQPWPDSVDRASGATGTARASAGPQNPVLAWQDIQDLAVGGDLEVVGFPGYKAILRARYKKRVSEDFLSVVREEVASDPRPENARLVADWGIENEASFARMVARYANESTKGTSPRAAYVLRPQYEPPADLRQRWLEWSDDEKVTAHLLYDHLNDKAAQGDCICAYVTTESYAILIASDDFGDLSPASRSSQIGVMGSIIENMFRSDIERRTFNADFIRMFRGEGLRERLWEILDAAWEAALSHDGHPEAMRRHAIEAARDHGSAYVNVPVDILAGVLPHSWWPGLASWYEANTPWAKATRPMASAFAAAEALARLLGSPLEARIRKSKTLRQYGFRFARLVRRRR